MSTILTPLFNLLKNGEKWVWSNETNKAFNEVKKKLMSYEILTHYNPNVQVKMMCDASPTGVGAVLFHAHSHNSKRPIAYASRTLTNAERGYSQLEKEALSLIFGVKSFYQYVFGREFILETDHKPLIFIFDEKKRYSSNGCEQTTEMGNISIEL